MRLMTYNIYNGAPETIDGVVSVVNDASPDVLVLNEANGFEKNDNQRLRTFAAATGFDHFFLEPCGDGDDYHVAVLSRSELITVEPLYPMSRAAIKFQTKDYPGVTLVGAHLSPYGEDARVKEATRILESLSGVDKSVIMGDLNSLSDQDGIGQDAISGLNPGQIRKFTTDGKMRFDVMRSLRTAGLLDTAVVAQKQDDTTVPTTINNDGDHANGLRLDYILVSSDLAPGASGYQVVKSAATEHASDHYPVTVDI